MSQPLKHRGISLLVFNTVIQDAASKRKMALAAVYQQMGEMLAQDERMAQHEVDCELEAGQGKLRDFVKKFNDNSERMQKAREEIDNLLSQAQTPAFLQVGMNKLPLLVVLLCILSSQ